MRLDHEISLVRIISLCWLACVFTNCVSQNLTLQDKCSKVLFYNLDSALLFPQCVETLILSDINKAPELCQFKNLEHLEIRNFEFTEYDEDISCLNRLESLVLVYGKLKSLPTNLPSIQTLILSHNQISSSAIEQQFLPLSLSVLELGNNPIQQVKLSSFVNLKNLKRLVLYESSTQGLNLSDSEKESFISILPDDCEVWFTAKHPYIKNE